ncbi:MAG: type II secretion system F family protein [Bacteroidia bacterium]|nr:type II secretion system F family protein [Bacteroidia bacterium]
MIRRKTVASIDISKYSTQHKASSVSTQTEGKGIAELLNKEISLFEKKFGAKEKEAFYSELGLLLSTGVDIKTAFEIIEEDIPDKKHRAMLEQIKNNIIGGKRIFEAVSAFSKVFSNYECQSIKIGEETGKLPEVLKELGSFYQSSIKLRRQIVGVLTYPVVVISMAILIVYFMLSFVVPIFSDIFSQSGGQLPELTQFLIRVSNKSGLIFYTLFAIILGAGVLHKTQSKKDWYRNYTSALFLKLPVVNKLIRKIYLTRFCQSMKLLSGARVMVHEALELVGNMIDYYPMEQALSEVKREVVMEGKLLNESLAKHSIFPKKLVALIKLSEEVNEPELIYEKLHSQYSAEIEHQQAVVGKLIEPVFIILLGLFVGFILVAMYLPMFEMSSGNF